MTDHIEHDTVNSFSELQFDTHTWRAHNFPGASSDASRQLAGVMEELGELAHAWLKQDQGIRTDEDLSDQEMDAIGDMVIYLCGYCSARNLSLFECINRAWDEVKDRDWVKYPGTGRPPQSTPHAHVDGPHQQMTGAPGERYGT